MRAAELVLTGNRTLAGQAREYTKRVEVIPSCVDPSAQPLREHREREQLTIGWIGSHTTVAYLEPLLPLIERLNQHGQRVTLVVVGGDTGVRASWIEHRRWSLATQATDLADFDIGVMPLPDTEWTRGKSGYKLLQYFSAGVPAVASPVGVNAEFVADGRGFAASTEAEWERALTELLTDASARRERGAAARSFVEKDYSYQRWAPELAALLRSLH
jgi:glycosyltransferase involved in cell wall biosynthesis